MNTDIGYILSAISFIVILNLMVFISIRVNYNSTRKPYLLIASIAIVVEGLRQVPALLLSFNPDSYPALLLTFLLQFGSSWMLLYAVLRRQGEVDSGSKNLLIFLLALYVCSTLFTVINGYPQSILHWIVVTLPGIGPIIAILWNVRSIEISALTGKILLVLSSTSLAVIRIALLLVDSVEMVYLLFYLDVLIFPVMVASLIFAEIESAHANVSRLLREKTRSEADLKFILDNAEDIILTVDEAGLLLTWNKRAEAVFGYTSAQTIRKMYVDHLFSGKYSHKNVDEEEIVAATMERMDGKTVPAQAKIKTLVDEAGTRTIYVIREGVLNET